MWTNVYKIDHVEIKHRNGYQITDHSQMSMNC